MLLSSSGVVAVKMGTNWTLVFSFPCYFIHFIYVCQAPLFLSLDILRRYTNCLTIIILLFYFINNINIININIIITIIRCAKRNYFKLAGLLLHDYSI